MKKYLKILGISALFGLMTLPVYADSYSEIKDQMNVGDVIIGNTLFSKDTFISANRAAKAGALYAKNNGTNLETYKYIGQGMWYVYDDSVGTFVAVKDNDKISNIENSLNINYINNKPLTYKIKAKDGNFYVLRKDNSLELLNFENSEQEENFIDMSYFLGDPICEDCNVTIDYGDVADLINFDQQNQILTCTYGAEFKFGVTYENGDTSTMVGSCGYKPLDFEMTDIKNLSVTPIKLESISISDASPAAYKNNSKVKLVSDVYGYNNQLTYLGDLESFEAPIYGMNLLGKWIVLDLQFAEGNSTLGYQVYTTSKVNYRTLNAEGNIIRLYVDATDLDKKVYFAVVSGGGDYTNFALEITKIAEDYSINLDTNIYEELNLIQRRNMDSVSYFVEESNEFTYYDRDNKKLYVNPPMYGYFRDDEGIKHYQIINNGESYETRMDLLIGILEYKTNGSTLFIPVFKEQLKDLKNNSVLTNSNNSDFKLMYFNGEVSEEQQGYFDELKNLGVTIKDVTNQFYE